MSPVMKAIVKAIPAHFTGTRSEACAYRVQLSGGVIASCLLRLPMRSSPPPCLLMFSETPFFCETVKILETERQDESPLAVPLENTFCVWTHYSGGPHVISQYRLIPACCWNLVWRRRSSLRHVRRSQYASSRSVAHENYLLHCEYLNKQYAPPKSATNYYGHSTCVDLRLSESAARSWMRLACYLVSKSSGFRAQYTPDSLLHRPAMLRSAAGRQRKKNTRGSRRSPFGTPMSLQTPKTCAQAARIPV
jgi:hypothetical protein